MITLRDIRNNNRYKKEQCSQKHHTQNSSSLWSLAVYINTAKEKADKSHNHKTNNKSAIINKMRSLAMVKSHMGELESEDMSRGLGRISTASAEKLLTVDAFHGFLLFMTNSTEKSWYISSYDTEKQGLT